MSAPTAVPGSITPLEVRDRLARGDALSLVDVREPIEYQIARIDGAVLLPLSDLPARLNALDRTQEIVVICHHGIRSRHACEYLVREGFHHVRNLVGGIDRWSVDVDPSIPRY